MLTALLLGLLTTFANILGSYLALLPRHPSQPMMANAIGFGGGFLLAAALMEMIPESLERGAWLAPFIALGYLVVYFAEQLFNVHLHQLPTEEDPAKATANPAPRAVRAHHGAPLLMAPATGMAALVAFNIHDFIDGLAIGSAMVLGPSLGTLVFLAVLFHEVPAGFVIAAIMLGAGRGRPAALLAGTSLGLVTLLGIAIPFWAGGLASALTDVFLALSAGTFIYIGATILIPVAETGRSRSTILLVALGFLAFYGSARLVGLFLGE